MTGSASRWRLGRGAVLVAATLALGAAACGDEQDKAVVGYDMEPAPEVGAFTLTSTTTDSEVPLRADPGKLLLVFLGYCGISSMFLQARLLIAGKFSRESSRTSELMMQNVRLLSCLRLASWVQTLFLLVHLPPRVIQPGPR